MINVFIDNIEYTTKYLNGHFVYEGMLDKSVIENSSKIETEYGISYYPKLMGYSYDKESNTTEFIIPLNQDSSFVLNKLTSEESNTVPTEYDTLMLYTAQFVVTDDVALTIPDIYPEWSADSVAYKLNEKVRYNDLLYKCLTAHTSQASWTPTDASSLWVRIDDPAEEWPEWRQPTGSTDAYAKGAKVAHNSKHWVSNVDNNTWEPGVYGWDEQTDTSAS